MTSAATSRASAALLRSAVPALVVVFALKTTLGMQRPLDIELDDETIYLDGARHLSDHFLPLARSSPLYPAWYRFVAVFAPDPALLYDTSWRIFSLGLPLLLYALARRSGAPRAAAAIASVAWAASSASVAGPPYIGMFAAALLGLGALASTWTARRPRAFAIGAATLSVTAFARPELALFAGGFLVVALGVIAIEARRSSPRGAPADIAIAIAPALVLGLGFGRQSLPFADDRSFFAFGQHYALHVAERASAGGVVDPWYDWESITRAAFPHATTIGEALRENPSAFLGHAASNLAIVGRPFLDILGPMQHLGWLVQAPLAIALGGVLSLGAYGALSRFGRRTPSSPSGLDRWRGLLVAVAAADLTAMIIIYPREHVALPLAFLLVAAAAASCRSVALAIARRLPALAHAYALVGLLALLVVLAPPRRAGTVPALLAPSGRPLVPDSAIETRRAVDVLRSLPFRGHVVMLEPEYSRGVYALGDYERVAQWDKREDEPFWDFVHRRGINVIVLDDRMRAASRFASDASFRAFASDESGAPREDFELHPVTGTPVVIAVRRTLLAADSR